MSLMLNLLVGLILLTNHAEVYANNTNQEFAKSVPIVDMHMHLFGKRPIFYKELMDRNGVKWGAVSGVVFLMIKKA